MASPRKSGKGKRDASGRAGPARRKSTSTSSATSKASSPSPAPPAPPTPPAPLEPSHSPGIHFLRWDVPPAQPQQWEQRPLGLVYYHGPLLFEGYQDTQDFWRKQFQLQDIWTISQAEEDAATAARKAKVREQMDKASLSPPGPNDVLPPGHKYYPVPRRSSSATVTSLPSLPPLLWEFMLPTSPGSIKDQRIPGLPKVPASDLPDPHGRQGYFYYGPPGNSRVKFLDELEEEDELFFEDVEGDSRLAPSPNARRRVALGPKFFYEGSDPSVVSTRNLSSDSVKAVGSVSGGSTRSSNRSSRRQLQQSPTSRSLNEIAHYSGSGSSVPRRSSWPPDARTRSKSNKVNKEAKRKVNKRSLAALRRQLRQGKTSPPRKLKPRNEAEIQQFFRAVEADLILRGRFAALRGQQPQQQQPPQSQRSRRTTSSPPRTPPAQRQRSPAPSPPTLRHRSGRDDDDVNPPDVDDHHSSTSDEPIVQTRARELGRRRGNRSEAPSPEVRRAGKGKGKRSGETKTASPAQTKRKRTLRRGAAVDGGVKKEEADNVGDDVREKEGGKSPPKEKKGKKVKKEASPKVAWSPRRLRPRPKKENQDDAGDGGAGKGKEKAMKRKGKGKGKKK